MSGEGQIRQVLRTQKLEILKCEWKSSWILEFLTGSSGGRHRGRGDWTAPTAAAKYWILINLEILKSWHLEILKSWNLEILTGDWAAREATWWLWCDSEREAYPGLLGTSGSKTRSRAPNLTLSLTLIKGGYDASVSKRPHQMRGNWRISRPQAGGSGPGSGLGLALGLWLNIITGLYWKVCLGVWNALTFSQHHRSLNLESWILNIESWFFTVCHHHRSSTNVYDFKLNSQTILRYLKRWIATEVMRALGRGSFD